MIDTSDKANAICGTLVKILSDSQHKELSESSCPSFFNIYTFEADSYVNENYSIKISAVKQDEESKIRIKDAATETSCLAETSIYCTSLPGTLGKSSL